MGSAIAKRRGRGEKGRFVRSSRVMQKINHLAFTGFNTFPISVFFSLLPFALFWYWYLTFVCLCYFFLKVSDWKRNRDLWIFGVKLKDHSMFCLCLHQLVALRHCSLVYSWVKNKQFLNDIPWSFVSRS